MKTQNENSWISVEERLPDLVCEEIGDYYSETVLLYGWATVEGKYVYGVGRRVVSDRKGFEYDEIDGFASNERAMFWNEQEAMKYNGVEATHWMPLPEPPNCGADMRGENDGL